MKKKILIYFISSITIIFLFSTSTTFAQQDIFNSKQDDLNIGGDIFSDFNDDHDGNEQLEDERYYRYGRFFSFQIGIGLNQFDGNRGSAYVKDPPTINFGVNYFLDFKSSFGLGFDISKNHFIIDYVPLLNRSENLAVNLVDVNHLTAYFTYRYYFDTSNLGTAVTYSNPYFVSRIEYWYQTIKYTDLNNRPDDVGGGLGFAVGMGFEFPLQLRESYLGIEMLIHAVNLPDKFTSDWIALDQVKDAGKDYPDFNGNAYSIIVTYVNSW